jgi:hypothetical protein
MSAEPKAKPPEEKTPGLEQTVRGLRKWLPALIAVLAVGVSACTVFYTRASQSDMDKTSERLGKLESLLSVMDERLRAELAVRPQLLREATREIVRQELDLRKQLSGVRVK